MYLLKNGNPLKASLRLVLSYLPHLASYLLASYHFASPRGARSLNRVPPPVGIHLEQDYLSESLRTGATAMTRQISIRRYRIRSLTASTYLYTCP